LQVLHKRKEPAVKTVCIRKRMAFAATDALLAPSSSLLEIYT
jgi:hypothetical protein